MCRYAGGKKRIARELHRVMREFEVELYGKDIKLPYFEPFVGMCNVAKEFDDGRPRILCDANPDITKLWQAVLYHNWKPPKSCITESYYNRLKDSKRPSAEGGFYGTACSFGGVYFSSFGGKYGEDTARKIQVGYNNLTKYKKVLKDAEILNAAPYDSFKPKGMLIYCDPPYARTVGTSCGKFLKKFDTLHFWDTMKKWSKHNLVFVSEEKAPSDFISIWSNKVHRVSNKGSLFFTEKLFVRN